MKYRKSHLYLLLFSFISILSYSQTTQTTFTNPIFWSDVPDVDVIRVGTDYYMVSTTVHLMPGAPIMKSKDMVNWEIISYLFDNMDDSEAYNLNGGNVYSRGQWAACIRYHNGRFYVIFGTGNTNKSYIFSATDPAGKWEKTVIDEYLHDPSVLFDDDEKVYIVYGGSKIRVRELKPDMTGLKEDGINKEIISGVPEGLLEGTHIYKWNNKYYMTLIWWPPGGRRTQLCYRSDKIDGPYEWKIILDDDLGYRNNGVAQGCILDTPEGNWYAMLFQDHDAVGRVPVLIPARWVDGWPMLGDENGKVPHEMKKPVQGYKPMPLVISDEFDNSYSKDKGKSKLALNWQWNHNPDNALWSLTKRSGYLRLTTGKVVSNILEARNTLTQRTEGPYCSANTAMDVSKMKDGDCAGLTSFSYLYGFVAVRQEAGKKFIVTVNRGLEFDKIPLGQDKIHLKINCDFIKDEAYFLYSLDGVNWKNIGRELTMRYTLDHFMGYRFGLFNFATKNSGGSVDFDYFRYEKLQSFRKNDFQAAPAPLFRDPVTDGAADPVVVYNPIEKAWWMLYTQRRANVETADVAYCYGNKIGIAYSEDNGRSWRYRGTLDLDIEKGENTFWAPEIVLHQGVYHLFVTYIRGVANHWSGKSRMHHYTSKNLWDWKFEGYVPLPDEHAIDATICRLPNGDFRMWYKSNDMSRYSDSKDLYQWTNYPDAAIKDQPHEGPKAFKFKGYYWLITDQWSGLGVYRSDDLNTWIKQSDPILESASSRPDDKPQGAHADVLVVQDKAYIFYFTHPGRAKHSESKMDENGNIPYEYRRSSIQAAALDVVDGKLIVLDRDKSFDFYLPDLY